LACVAKPSAADAWVVAVAAEALAAVLDAAADTEEDCAAFAESDADSADAAAFDSLEAAAVWDASPRLQICWPQLR